LPSFLDAHGHERQVVAVGPDRRAVGLQGDPRRRARRPDDVGRDALSPL